MEAEKRERASRTPRTRPLPPATKGKITLMPTQLAMLLEGIDWRLPQRSWRPLKLDTAVPAARSGFPLRPCFATVGDADVAKFLPEDPEELRREAALRLAEVKAQALLIAARSSWENRPGIRRPSPRTSPGARRWHDGRRCHFLALTRAICYNPNDCHERMRPSGLTSPRIGRIRFGSVSSFGRGGDQGTGCGAAGMSRRQAASSG